MSSDPDLIGCSIIYKAEVIFLGSGVLNELSRYLGENVDKQTHNIKDLLYNIPCVHRSFAITYTGTTELFVPIRNLKFIREDRRISCRV